MAGACADASVQPESCATERGCDESTLTPVPPVPPVPPSVVDDPSCALVPELAGTIAWPNEGRCPNRAGRTPLLGPPTGARVVWKLALGNAGSSNDPVIGPDGTIYVTHGNQVFAARADGTRVFASEDLGGLLPFGAAVTRDAVVVASGTNAVSVIGLHPQTGIRRWTTALTPTIGARADQGDLLLVANDVVVVSVATGLAAVSAKTGALLWQTLSPAQSPIQGANGRLLATSGQELRSFDLTMPGSPIVTNTGTTLSPWLSSGSAFIYIGGPQALTAVSLLDPNDRRQNALVTPGPRAAVTPNMVYVQANAGRIAALTPDLSARTWISQPLGTNIVGSAIVDGARLVYAAADDATTARLRGLDGATGNVVVDVDLGSGTRSSPAIGDGRKLYYVDMQGNLVCVGPP